MNEKLPQTKSFAPPAQRGIHELIDEIESLIADVQERVHIVKNRLAEFDSLQSQFYNGRIYDPRPEKPITRPPELRAETAKRLDLPTSTNG